jgi:hypothetical protein
MRHVKDLTAKGLGNQARQCRDVILLHQIEHAAIDPSHALANPLRKCLAVSHRLIRWRFDHELSGFPEKREPPERDVDLPC